MGVSQNNLKSCSECGRRINKGDYCWRIRERTNHDGSQHLCESCTLLLSRADELDILSSRLCTAQATGRSSCSYCDRKLPEGARVAQVRIRSTRGQLKVMRLCLACIQNTGHEISVYPVSYTHLTLPTKRIV